MPLKLKSFIRELKEILEDIRDNENVDANSAENGFSDSYSLKTEIHYLNEIEKKLEQEREVKIVEKIINKDGEKLTEDELLRLIKKDGRLVQIVNDLNGALTEIRKENARIVKIEKMIEECKARKEAIKHIYIGIVKRLIGISENIDELKEEIAV